MEAESGGPSEGENAAAAAELPRAAAALAHDFNELLSAIKATARSIRSSLASAAGISDPAELERRFRVIDSAVIEAARLAAGLVRGCQAAGEGAPLAGPRAFGPSAPAGSKGRALVLEAGRMRGAAVAKALELYGWEVVREEGGTGEGERAARGGFSLLVADVDAAAGTKTEYAAKLRELAPGAALLLSSASPEDLETRAAAAMADGFLARPYAREDLERAIRALEGGPGS